VCCTETRRAALCPVSPESGDSFRTTVSSNPYLHPQTVASLCGSSKLSSIAHIFCTVDQVEQEIQDAFDFLDAVYKPFGFTYKVGLSTRNPKKWVGDLKIWDKAEATLKEVLERRMPGNWHVNEEDAAFYGPKVGVASDILRKPWDSC
jgi:hypothetical protein